MITKRVYELVTDDIFRMGNLLYKVSGVGETEINYRRLWLNKKRNKWNRIGECLSFGKFSQRIVEIIEPELMISKPIEE